MVDGPFPELDSDLIPDSKKQGKEENEEPQAEVHPLVCTQDGQDKGWFDFEEAPPQTPHSPILSEPKLSDHEQQPVVSLETEDKSESSDDSLSLHLCWDVDGLHQQLGMNPQEPLLSDDKLENEDICGAPDQCSSVSFEDDASSIPQQLLAFDHHLHMHTVALHMGNVLIPCFSPSTVVYSPMFVASMTSRIWR